MRPSHSAPEAPTHLRAGDLPPGLLDHIDQIRHLDQSHALDRSHSASASRTKRRAEPDALPQIPAIDDHSIVSVSRSSSRCSRSELAPAPRVRTEPSSQRTPQQRPAPRAPQATPQPVYAQPVPQGTPQAMYAQPAVAQSAARPVPSASVAQSVRSARAGSVAQPQPTPVAVPAAPQATPPAMPPAMPAGIGAIDPLAIPTPPELAGPIYGHIRRLALQADLAGADRVLRDALAELTSSLACAIVYPGTDGLWTLGDDTEIPRDAQPLVAIATARRALIASHVAMIPVVTTTETVAVITLTRNNRQPAYQLVEQIAMVALAREAAPILHHLAVQHLQRQSEIKADRGSLYRGEALEAHRTRGQEGQLVQLSPAWVKRAYPLLIVTILIAIGFAIFVKVPTYSTGTAVVVFEGSTSVTATASGTVEKVFVHENEAVKKGDPVIRLNSPDEVAQLAAAEAEWRNLQAQFLLDQSDEQIRKSLASAATSRDHALARVEARTIRAPRDGVVTNLHAKEGVALQLGGYAMQITDENSEIEVLAFLPSKDSPRIREKMGMQLELDGYKKARVEAAKLGGDMLTESIAKDLQLGTTWITARARLPERTFKTEHNTYHYHHGMHAVVEVKIQSKPFLATLLPAIEKYLPD
ncbi:MAG: HlyD family efflux transporter periplasmic adaptor subunit [Deltaproteobacteria bacterium]|nr:MAG: HlyD family efflux transporter periplasmic adaptor subunit [Deltaproteobacteria bacterium]